MTSLTPSSPLSPTSEIIYEGALLFWKTVTSIFFREVRPRGAFNIPRDGPVIFVVAPHHNQVSCLHSEYPFAWLTAAGAVS